MFRKLNRSATLSSKGISICRKRHSPPGVLCLKWDRTEFNGVDVNLGQLGDNCSLKEFDARLKESILHWRKDAKKSVWMKVPITQSYLIPVAFHHGFNYHHAVGNYAMLLKWLPQQVACSVPPYATHQIGVAGMVINEEKNEVLVVQDKHMVKFGQTKKAVWKFPGGLSDEGESIENTAVREVYEETGVKSEFKSIIMFRQQHQVRNTFDKSDIYIICRMTPLSYGISRCEDEIAKCEWMKLSALLTHSDTGPMTRLAARLAAYGLKKGFENVDIMQNRMKHWVDPNKTVCLFHRYLPT